MNCFEQEFSGGGVVLWARSRGLLHQGGDFLGGVMERPRPPQGRQYARSRHLGFKLKGLEMAQEAADQL
jgi:hypothetical protein